VTDGPFAETKEILASYWMIQVKSKEEAIAWAKRVLFDRLPNVGRAPEIEIRQVFEPTDFPEATAEMIEQETSFNAARFGTK
jgi:hypothetical protein